MMSALSRRWKIAATLLGMAWRRRIYILLPTVVFLALIVLLLYLAESPVLIPFFYAVF